MPIIESRLRIVLVAATLMIAPMLSMVPHTASATPVVVDRFTDGSTGATLNFSAHAFNDSLAVELPRGADIQDAELTVTGVEGSSIGSTTMDFSNTAIGDDLWALWKEGINIYPPTVDPYSSGWTPIATADVANMEADDTLYWQTQTTGLALVPPFDYPLQLYHFHPDVGSATSYEVCWKGYGTCAVNGTYVYQAELWLYNHTDSSWELVESYGSNSAGDVWLNASLLPSDPFVSPNGSVDAVIAGPRGEINITGGTIKRDFGHLYTNYIALDVGTPGTMEFPQNATLRVADVRMNLSAGPLKGPLAVGDALGLRDALQAAIDAEVVMPGTLTIPLNISVEWRTLSRISVGGLRVEYEPVVNVPPAWRGPASVDLLEDSQWTELVDLGAAFSDDHNQDALRFALVSSSDPLNLSTRMQFGTISGNWTLMAKPAHDFFGEVAVVLNATDLFGEVTASPALTVRVVPTGDRPSIVDAGELHASEGARFQTTLQATDPDLPDDALTWSDSSDLLDVDPDTGAIDWTPGKDQIGTHRFTVTVTDRFALQAVATVTIVVANSNDPPVITSALALTVDQDQAVEYTIAATDPDAPFGDVLTFYAFSEDIEVLCDMATGIVTFTPTNDNIGSLSILLRVQDRAGLKDDRTLAVTVRNVNDPPSLQGPGPQMHDQGEAVSVRFFATDPDLSVAGAGERITLTTDGPAWLAPDASGWVNVTLDQSRVGVWWANYTLTDAAGLSSRVLVVWTVTDVNDPPVITTAVPPVVNAREGERLVLELHATDLDGNALVWSDDSSLFTVGSTNGTIAFTPIQSDVGTHRVTVTVADGHQGLTSASFDIVVANVNDPPVIGNVAPLSGTSYKQGEAVSFLATATDRDGDRLTYIWKEGARELGRGSPFTTSSLRPGKHTVTLVVDDGNATVERQTSVVVKEEEGGVGLMAILLVLAIVAVVVIVAVMMAMRSRKGKAQALADQQSASLAWPGDADREPAATAPEAEKAPSIEIEHREA